MYPARHQADYTVHTPQRRGPRWPTHRSDVRLAPPPLAQLARRTPVRPRFSKLKRCLPAFNRFFVSGSVCVKRIPFPHHAPRSAARELPLKCGALTPSALSTDPAHPPRSGVMGRCWRCCEVSLRSRLSRSCGAWLRSSCEAEQRPRSGRHPGGSTRGVNMRSNKGANKTSSWWGPAFDLKGIQKG